MTSVLCNGGFMCGNKSEMFDLYRQKFNIFAFKCSFIKLNENFLFALHKPIVRVTLKVEMV